ncbi:IS30 family transposase, partial [Kribbella antibiotica]
MSVSLAVDVERHGGVLLRMVDGGVAVAVACESLGIRADRGYEVLRVLGRSGAGRRTVITDGLREQVIAEFKATGNITGAGRVCGLRHDTARRILAVAGLVAVVRAVKHNAQAKARFEELVEAGCSITAAAREVGVDRRTGWDWHHGVRTVRGARVYPDGRVVGSGAATCYATVVTP